MTLELEVDTSLNLRDGLVNRGLDIAFLLGPVSQPTIQNRPLCSYPLAWVTSPGWVCRRVPRCRSRPCRPGRSSPIRGSAGPISRSRS
ncbi:LysR substrate-binding domain-containing protein [Tistrella bauzanensis]